MSDEQEQEPGDGYNVGGVIVNKPQLLAWADSLQTPAGLLTVALIAKVRQASMEEAAGRDGIKSRQIHELRGAFMRVNGIANLLSEIVTQAAKARAEEAAKIK